VLDSLLLKSPLTRDGDGWTTAEILDNRDAPGQVISGFLCYFSSLVNKFPLTYRSGLTINIE
jgi:hypothetical protein